MRILFAADIHVNPDHLGRLIRVSLDRNADVLIIGGDIVPHHLPGAHAMGILEAQAIYLETELIPRLKKLKASRDVEVFLDFGNDDFMASRRLLEPYQGKLLHLLHMQVHALTPHVDVVGYMMVPPTPFKRKDWEKPDAKAMPCPPAGRIRLKGYATGKGYLEETLLDLHSGRTIEADLAQLSSRIQRPFIFVSHCPPLDTPLDMLAGGTHVGSISIRRFIEKWSRRKLLIASLHGHVHESPDVSNAISTRINGTMAINPGQAHDLRCILMELSEEGENCRITLLEQ
ncbi:MAG: metallophosphoesterase [Desulfobacteraceae bacterium]|jgi:Icc-related predicted phosphoesterase